MLAGRSGLSLATKRNAVSCTGGGCPSACLSEPKSYRRPPGGFCPSRSKTMPTLISSSHLRTAARPPLINSSSDRLPPALPFEIPLALAPPFSPPFCCCCCCWTGPFFPLPPAASPPFPPFFFFPLPEKPASRYTAGIAATAAAAVAAPVVSNRPPPAPTPRGRLLLAPRCCWGALDPARPALFAIVKPPCPSGRTRLPPPPLTLAAPFPPRLRDERSTLRLLGSSRARA